jgi:hypothetical protein
MTPYFFVETSIQAALAAGISLAHCDIVGCGVLSRVKLLFYEIITLSFPQEVSLALTRVI